MGCLDENKRRKTYKNVKRLAEISHRANGLSYVIFEEKTGEYGYCDENSFSETRGLLVEYVPFR
jgi:hypothetical protein